MLTEVLSVLGPLTVRTGQSQSLRAKLRRWLVQGGFKGFIQGKI